MTRPFLLLAAVWLSAACSAPESAKPSGQVVPKSEEGNFFRLEHDDPEIVAAAAKAQSTLDGFIAKFRDKVKYKMTTVKFPLEIGDKTEHIWMDVDDYKDGYFTGPLANDSIYDPSIKVGKPMRVKREKVEDWMLMDQSDKTEGGFSVEVVRKKKQ